MHQYTEVYKLTREYGNALNAAIRVTESDNDLDFLKSVTDMDDLSGDKLRTALDSIYINGKNLTDTLGEENQNDISAYANAVRNAMSKDNKSFVTIMKRNSIFANPRAVIPENDHSDSEAWTATDEKISISVHYAANYRQNMHDSLIEAEKKLDEKQSRDAHLFFDSLFYNEDGTLKNAAEDPKNMSYGDLTAKAVTKFDHIIPRFIVTRSPENLIYSYMMIKEYPEGSGKKLTYEQLFEDESEEMIEFKKKCGKEFISLFTKEKDKDNVEKFNNQVYPTLMEMAKSTMQQKVGYNDISETSNIDKTVMAEAKTTFINDLFQQVSAVINTTNVMGKVAGPLTLATGMLGKRLAYLKSDLYLNDGDISEECRTNYEVENAVKTQALADTYNTRNILDMPIGHMESECETELEHFIGFIDIFHLAEGNEAEKFKNGEENEYIKEWEKPEHKNKFKRIERSVEDSVKNPPEDPIFSNVAGGGGTFVLQTLPNQPYIATCSFSIDDLQKYKDGIDIPMTSEPELANYRGTKKGLLYALTGCTYTENHLCEVTNEDRKMLMAAANAILINGVPMSERFHLKENDIEENIKAAEKRLADIILNSSTDVVSVKNGKNSISAVTIKAPQPRRSFYDSQEEYEQAKVMSEHQANKKNISIAYAQLSNCIADDNELDTYANVLKENGIKLPARHISRGAAEDIFEKSNRDRILPMIIGKNLNDNNELAEAAKNIYIGNSTLSDLCPVDANKSIKENLEEMGKLLRDTMNKNMHTDNECTPIMFKDKYGKVESVMLDMEPPVRPKPVELLTGAKAFFSIKSTREANKREYDEYVAAENRYINDSEQYKRFAKYNEAVEKARRNMIRVQNGEEPQQRNVSLNQIVSERRGNSPVNTPANSLTAPVEQHTVQNDGPALN